jgi:hypothetical protein
MLRSPVLTVGNQRVVVCASGCIIHTPAIVQPHAYTSQSSAAVTHCILIATNLPTPEGWTAWLTVSAPGIWTRDPSNSCAMKHDGARHHPLSHADRPRSNSLCKPGTHNALLSAYHSYLVFQGETYVLLLLFSMNAHDLRWWSKIVS